MRLGAGFGFVCGEREGGTSIYAFEAPLAMRAVMRFKRPRFVSSSGNGALVIRGTCSDDAAVLEGLLSALELTVPVERIWLDVAEQGGSGPPEPSAAEIAELAAPLASLASQMDNTDEAGDRLDSVLRSLGVTSPNLRAAVIQKLGEK